ncbi:MAG: hypothetical protein AB3N15_06905 [Paracoccaceae bacterium]
MSDDDEAPKKTEPGRASRLALEAAAQIADWCERRKKEAIEDAKRQMWTVWTLLGGGVVLLLVLPRLVALIDYTAATLPPDAVKEAAAALSLMETNESEMQEDLGNASAGLDKRQDELRAAEEVLEAATMAFEDPFEDPLAVWQRAGPADIDFEINVFTQQEDGLLLAAGRERTEEGSRILLLRSEDGEVWSSVRPEEAGARIAGRLFALAPAPDGGLIAAGAEETEDGYKTLLLRSEDGAAWSPIRPEEAGARIAGWLFALASAPDGGLIAAGGEETEDGDKTLLLRSEDGAVWSPIGPEEAGVRIAGRLDALAPAPDGGLIAAGREATEDGDRTLLLRSEDGAAWSPIPQEEADTRIAGAIYVLAATPDGGLIAAGREATEDGEKTLLLRSEDGEDWSPLRPEEAGARIAGRLYAFAPAPDGGLLAAGREQTDEGDWTLLLRSEDGAAWSPLRSEMSGSRFGPWYWALFSGSDGTVYADGLDTPFVRSAPADRAVARRAILDGEPAPDFAVPDGSADRAEAVRQATRAAEIARDLADQQTRIRDQAKASHQRQTVAVEQIKEANKTLEDALRRTEPIRQASWIATRLAVIALLIFLVQIVVNRYRYLQRLADFYDGRAQAFRMLANAGPTAAGVMLHNVSLNELMAGLSPSAISFGREAEPPTQHLMSILQTAIKK